MSNCIGLFGTCGDSKWRVPFIEKFHLMGIEDGVDFFNPQKDDWKPEDAVIEAEHLANDSVLCWPVTGETYGLGSLGEVGFSILNSIKMDDRRDFIVMIELELSSEIMVWDRKGKPSRESKESLRMRALVSEHLKKLRLANVYVVDNFDQMLEIALRCYAANATLAPYRKRFNPHLKNVGSSYFSCSETSFNPI